MVVNKTLAIQQLVKSSLYELCHKSLLFEDNIHISGSLKFSVDAAELHEIVIDENIKVDNVVKDEVDDFYASDNYESDNQQETEQSIPADNTKPQSDITSSEINDDTNLTKTNGMYVFIFEFIRYLCNTL